MSMVTVRSDVSSLKITSVDWDHDATTLNFLNAMIANYEALIKTAALLALHYDELDVGNERRNDLIQHMDLVASQFSVGRLTYASPLELVLSASAAIGSASATFFVVSSRVLKLYERYLDLRVKKSNTDFHVAMTNDVLDHLGMSKKLHLKVGTGLQVPRGRVGEQDREIVDTVQRGVQALAATQTVKLEPN